MTTNRLGLWLALGALVAACSSQAANNFGSGDGGSDATSGDASGDSSGGSSGSSSGTLGGSSSGGSSGSSSGSSSGAGSSSGNTGSSSGGSSGSGSSSGSSSGGSSGSSSGGPTDAGPDANCGSSPTLHADPAGTLFCGYQTDGGTLECVASSGDDVCCLGGEIGGAFAPQMCAVTPAGCTNGSDGGIDAGQTPAVPISCYQVADCTNAGFSGAVACCLQGGILENPAPGCTYPKATHGNAVVCEGTAPGADAAATTTGACATGEIQICSAQSDCPTGTTCTAAKWKIFQVGLCL